MDRDVTDIVSCHQALLKPTVSLFDSLAVVLIQCSKCLDLIVKVFDEWFRKVLHQTSQLYSIVVFRGAGFAIVVKLVEPRRKGTMLFYILFHDSFGVGDVLNIWKEYFFLGIVVVMHALAPTLAVGQEISGNDRIVCW